MEPRRSRRRQHYHSAHSSPPRGFKTSQDYHEKSIRIVSTHMKAARPEELILALTSKRSVINHSSVLQSRLQTRPSSSLGSPRKRRRKKRPQNDQSFAARFGIVLLRISRRCFR